MDTFDVATAIAEFAVDSERTSLQLPHMTTGQRKNAKKLLEQYSELQCASYGFGAERRLHLLKSSVVEKEQEDKSRGLHRSCGFTAPAVNIKNTFIDDWVESVPVNRRAIQSMPHHMFSQCLLDEATEASAGSVTPSTAGDDTRTTASEADVESDDAESGRHLWSDEPLELRVGALVVVGGLLKAPAFNGRSAIVQGWDEATGRYNILFASASGSQLAKIKEENLRVISPCP
jgi:hypothetical protein